MTKQIGKNAPPMGVTPAVILENPKHAHNVAKTLRLCSCFGLKQLWWTGDRVQLADYQGKGKRLPREERMKGYKDVELVQFDRPSDHFKSREFRECTVVGVELTENAIPLDWMPHCVSPVFVFGPEDGSIGKVSRSFCHYMVTIPVRHCLNLATAVGITLWHWHMTQMKAGTRLSLDLAEDRGVLRGEEELFA